MNDHINLFSLNVGTSSSLAGLQALIDTENLDLVFLQEVRLSTEQIESLIVGFHAVANIDPDHSSRPGTALVWKKGLPVTDIIPLVNCRMQVARLGSLNLINIYAPSGSDRKAERGRFYGEDVFQAIQLWGPQGIGLLCGDFNAVINQDDIEGGIGFAQKKCVNLENLIHFAGLLDSF